MAARFSHPLNGDSMTRDTQRTLIRLPLAYCLGIAVAGTSGALSGCNKEEESTKTTKTTTTKTPEGERKTTETVEKKVETEKK